MSLRGLELVEVGFDEDGLAVVSDLLFATQPEWVRSPELMLAQRQLDPDMRRVIARLDGVPIGVGTVGRIWVYPPEYPVLWSELGVLSEHRRKGVGSALLTWASGVCREKGKAELNVPCSDGRPDGVAFLRNRGFTEYDRMACVELPLVGRSAPEFRLPDGVELTSLAERPELRASAYEAAVEIFAALPDPDPVEAGTFEEWRVRDVDVPNGPLDGYLLAVVDDAVVGYCRLLLQERGRSVGHMMTGTRRAWQGRGIAQALKSAAIGWALAAGAERMTTENAVGNEAMRAINRKLGFVPAPDFVELRGLVVA
ncbi:MAG: GNAT family N-acetyltransferase [Gaiellales bacterium]